MVHLSDKLISRVLQFKAKKDDAALQDRFSTFWKILVADEEVLLKFLAGQGTLNGNTLIPNMLYALNNETPKEVCDTLKLFALPESKIGSDTMKAFMGTVTDKPGYVGNAGDIFVNNMPCSELDQDWTELLLSYLWYLEFPDEVAKFGTNPSVLKVDDDQPLSIAILGDWGTGQYDDFGIPSPATLVSKAIASMKPQISIHLGDTYYAGTEAEVSKKLLVNFPCGSVASYTMTGNHEMFDGANGFFKTALTNSLFDQQQQTSYFAIVYGSWVIIGLDTAYYDTSMFYGKGALSDADQLAFIKSLNIRNDQKIILLTHHCGLSFDGTKINDPLFSQVYSALGSRYPDYWYYGHEHQGIVFNNSSAQGSYRCPSGQSPQLRCFGHAAIPIGRSSLLCDANGKPVKGIDYCSSSPVTQPGNNGALANRVRNGFGVLTLSKETITEQAYEASESGEAIPVWSNAGNNK